MSKNKKLRLESGQLVQKNKMVLGELYEKWQKKNNASIGRTGVFDDNDNFEGDTSAKAAASIKSRNNKKWNEKDNFDNRGRTSIQIQKERNKKSDQKMKNMERKERRGLERNMLEKRQPKGSLGRKLGKIWSGKSSHGRR